MKKDVKAEAFEDTRPQKKASGIKPNKNPPVGPNKNAREAPNPAKTGSPTAPRER